MIRRGLKTAVVDVLKANYLGTYGNCEVRVVPPPGKPYGCAGPVAFTVWDAPVTYFSNVGHYTNNGCFVTISLRGKCTPGDRLDGSLDDVDGWNDLADQTAAILDHFRYEIMNYANQLVDMAPRGGIWNGLIEAPRAVNLTSWELKTPDWWSEALLATRVQQTDMQRMAGYAATLYYGDAKQLQYLDAATG